MELLRHHHSHQTHAALTANFLEVYQQDSVFLERSIAALTPADLHRLRERGYLDATFGEALHVLCAAYNRLRGVELKDFARYARSYTGAEFGSFLRSVATSRSKVQEIDLTSLEEDGIRPDLEVVNRLIEFPWEDRPIQLDDAFAIAAVFGSSERVAELRGLQGNDQAPLFRSASTLALFGRIGGTPDDLRLLTTFENSIGRPLFGTLPSLLAFTRLKDRQHIALEATRLRDPGGYSVFGNGLELCDFVAANGTVEEAQKFAALTTPDGRRAFDGYEIALLREAGVSISKAREWADAAVDAVSAVIRSRLGIDRSGFSESGLPKCLLFLPASDHRQWFRRAFIDESVGFYRNLVPHYDVYAVTALHRSHLLNVLEQHAAGLSLVIQADHGQRDGMQVGRDQSAYGTPLPLEEFVFRIGDPDLSRAVARLPSGCKIFLDSCGTAEGGRSDDHFAGFIARSAPHCTVIASEVPFDPRDLVIHSVKPFDTRIVIAGKDCTYVAQGGAWADASHRVAFREHPLLTAQQDPYSVEFGHLTSNTVESALFSRCLEAVTRARHPLLNLTALEHAQEELARCPGVALIERRDLVYDRYQESWQYLFGERYAEPWCPARGRTAPGPASRLITDHAATLKELGYKAVRTARDGDLAVYYQNVHHEGDSVRPIHFGEWREGGVVSKFPYTHILHHRSDYSPAAAYGADPAVGLAAVFYRRTRG